MIMIWNTKIDDDDQSSRYYDVRTVDGIGRSVVGINHQLERACEFVIDTVPSRINRHFESVRSTWICVDRLLPGNRRVAITASFNIDFLTFYPRDQDMYRHDDMFILHGSILDPEKNPLFDHDRDVFAERLLHKTHECWVRSWRLLEDVMGRPAKRWPVRLWIHQKPERVWEINAEDKLVERPDLAPADERMLQIGPPGPPVSPEEEAEVDRLQRMPPDEQMMYLSGLAKEHDRQHPPPVRKPVPLPPWRV